MPDMISIFNQLTQSELADCLMFENILDQHYQKFKYFYMLIEDLKLDSVQSITCGDGCGVLLVIMTFKSKSDSVKFKAILKAEINNFAYSTFAKYFDITIKDIKNCLNISIESKNYSKEEDMYEDRFDSC